MSESAASRLLSDSYDRKLTLEENEILKNALATEPALAELKYVLDRIRGVHQQDSNELEIPSPQVETTPVLSALTKLTFKSLVQDALQTELQQQTSSWLQRSD